MKYTFAAADKQRLDQAIAENIPEMTRSQIQKIIKTGGVCIKENQVTKAGYQVEKEQEVVIELPEKDEDKKVEVCEREVEILFEDDHIIAVNKPKDLVVHPAAGHQNDTLVNILLSKTDEPLPIHRLDKDTTGVILFAKSVGDQAKFQELFKEREVKKSYRAIIAGHITPKKGIIDAPIARHSTDRKKMSVRKTTKARDARTGYEVVGHGSVAGQKITCVDCDLMTGRTHQIRVHFAAIKHPIIGDQEYGGIQPNAWAKKELKVTTQLLHAHTIEFVHPYTKEKIKLVAPLPKEIEDLQKECQ